MSQLPGRTLNDLLQAGALPSAIQGVLTDESPDTIASRLSRRFPGASQAAIQGVLQRAQRAVSAGTLADVSSGSEGVPLSAIPINPFRQGRPLTERGRFEVRATVGIIIQGGATRYVTIFLQTDSVSSVEKIRADIESAARGKFVDSVQNNAYPETPADAGVDVNIASIERIN